MQDDNLSMNEKIAYGAIPFLAMRPEPSKLLILRMESEGTEIPKYNAGKIWASETNSLMAVVAVAAIAAGFVSKAPDCECPYCFALREIVRIAHEAVGTDAAIVLPSASPTGDRP